MKIDRCWVLDFRFSICFFILNNFRKEIFIEGITGCGFILWFMEIFKMINIGLIVVWYKKYLIKFDFMVIRNKKSVFNK